MRLLQAGLRLRRRSLFFSQIVTTFAIVASVIGANLSAEVVVISGFAKLVGDGIASACVAGAPKQGLTCMPVHTRNSRTCAAAVGMGDTISEIAEMNYIQGERAREMEETETRLE